MSERHLLESIARLVPPGSRVLDLGCGDGALLAHLQTTRQCSGYGVEIDDAKVHACIRRGVRRHAGFGVKVRLRGGGSRHDGGGKGGGDGERDETGRRQAASRRGGGGGHGLP